MEVRRLAVVRRSDESGLQPRDAFLVERPAEPGPVEKVGRVDAVPPQAHPPDAGRSALRLPERQQPVARPQERRVVSAPRPEPLGELALQVSVSRLRERLPVAQMEQLPVLRAVLPLGAAQLPLELLRQEQCPERLEVATEARQVSGQWPERPVPHAREQARPVLPEAQRRVQRDAQASTWPPSSRLPQRLLSRPSRGNVSERVRRARCRASSSASSSR